MTFHLPKTLSIPRQPKYPRHAVEAKRILDEFAVIKYPLTTESAMKKIEDYQTLVFIADVRANKHQIKQAVKKLYDIKATSVNTLVRPGGDKKAFVRVHADQDALEIANKVRYMISFDRCGWLTLCARVDGHYLKGDWLVCNVT